MSNFLNTKVLLKLLSAFLLIYKIIKFYQKYIYIYYTGHFGFKLR